MKTLGFDMRPLQKGFKAHKERGIGVYTKSLITRRELAPGELSIIPFHDSCYEAGEAIKTGSTEYTVGRLMSFARPYMKEYFNQHLLMRRVIERTLKKAGANRMFFPTHLDAPAGLKAPYAVTAHDMIHSALLDRHYSSFKQRMHISKQIEVLENASLIIAVSNHTKEDLLRYARVEEGRVVVVHNGVEKDFRPGAPDALKRFSLPQKFVLNIGGIDWRKNMELLLGSFGALVKSGSDLDLVIAGAIEGDPQYSKFMRSIEDRSLKPRVHTIGYVSKDELISLYNRASIFFYPSLYEGFGLPVLEAMACGTPVISTNRSSIPEVAGEAAVALDPNEPASFDEALIKLAGSGAEREKLSEAGIKRAKQFSWDICAKKTWEALSAV